MNSFEYDFLNRTNPELMNRLLSEAVPAINITRFKYLKVKKGYCQSVLPLNRESSNQHGTHQALLLGMAADYTGGLALASIIENEPILGVHEISADKGMSLWLIHSSMKYLKPSVEDVTLEAFIPEENHNDFNKRYHNGSILLTSISISFKNPQGEDVAEGVFKYYCKKKNSLAPAELGQRPNAMFEHILKTSAKMIAKLRALEANKEQPLFIDSISENVAGKQGQVIADRFLKILPELQPLVAARTFHLDKTALEMNKEIKQFVFLGVGLDFRIFRQRDVFKHKNVFELDLAEMLTERNRLSKSLNLDFSFLNSHTQINCNFLSDSISEKLIQNGYDPELPTFFIFEGCSMYFNEKENLKILMEIKNLMTYNLNSVLWMDMVDIRVLGKNIKSDGLNYFLSGMAKLGEPFVSGFDSDNDEILKSAELHITSKSFTHEILSVDESDIYSYYSFALLKPEIID